MYVVRIEQSSACPTAVVKANTTRREFPSLWAGFLDEVWAFVRATPDLRNESHNIMLYRHGLPDVELWVEVGVQVSRRFEPAGRVVPSELPATEVATTIHPGSPAEIGAAYAAIREYCRSAGRTMTGVSWEVYGHPDPDTGQYDIAVCSELADA